METKQIKNFPNYRISDKGRVFSYAQKASKEMRQQRMKNNYYTVYLSNNGIKKRLYVHRLVAQMFISNPDYKTEVNHKDGDKANNCVENLEWVTRSENQTHSHRILGNPSPALNKCGKLHPRSKPVIAIKNGIIYEFESIHLAANILKVGYKHIIATLKGYKGRKTAYGYRWEYKKDGK